MKLLRWTLAGASAYVIYKYTIGNKAKGEDVFNSPERDIGEPAPKPKRKPAAKKPTSGSSV